MSDIIANLLLVLCAPDKEGCFIAGDSCIMPYDIVLSIGHCPGGHLDRLHSHIVLHLASHPIASLAYLSNSDIGDFRSLLVIVNCRHNHPLLRDSTIALIALNVGSIGHSATKSIQEEALLIDDIEHILACASQHPLLGSVLGSVLGELLNIGAIGDTAILQIESLAREYRHDGVIAIAQILQLPTLVLGTKHGPQVYIGIVLLGHMLHIETEVSVGRVTNLIGAVCHCLRTVNGHEPERLCIA